METFALDLTRLGMIESWEALTGQSFPGVRKILEERERLEQDRREKERPPPRVAKHVPAADARFPIGPLPDRCVLAYVETPTGVVNYAAIHIAGCRLFKPAGTLRSTGWVWRHANEVTEQVASQVAPRACKSCGADRRLKQAHNRE
jgi:hypothetical protein